VLRPFSRNGTAFRRFTLGGALSKPLGPIAALLVAVGVSPANGFIGGAVVYQRDTSVFYYPLFLWAAQELRQGRFPLWTPEIMGGYPLFADSEIGLASPQVLLALLTLPADIAFVALRLLHVAIAALGAYALARAWRLPHAAAVICGLTFALGSFLQAHLHHENIVRTAAWLPLVLTCVEHSVRADSRRVQARWIVAGAISLAFAAVGLHPQILAAVMLALAIYAVLRVWVGASARPLLVVPATAALGLALAAVQLVPLSELAGLSARASNTFPYTEVAGHSLTPYGLVQLVLPFVFRDAELRQWGLWTHWESYLYVGLVPLALVCAAFARIRRREVAMWVVLGAVGLLLALGQYLPYDFFALLRSSPGLSWLRAPGRFSVIVDLSLAMLAAYGLVVLQAQAQRVGPYRWSARFAIGTLIVPLSVIGGLVVLRSLLLAAPDVSQRLIEEHYLSLPRDLRWAKVADIHAAMLWSSELVNPRTVGAVLGLLAIAIVLVLWLASPWAHVRRWPGWSTLLVLGAAADLLFFSWGIHPREALSTIATPHPAAAAVRQLVDSLEPGQRPARVLASPVLNQVAADRLAPLGLHEAGGYSSLDPSRHRAYFRHVRQVDDDLVDLWNVRYVLDPAQYGALAVHHGVQYLPANALLRSASHADLGEETFHVPAGFRLSEVRVVSALIGAADVRQGQVVASLTVRADNGRVLAQGTLRAGHDVMDSAWDEGARHGRVEVGGDVQEPQPDGSTIRRVLSYASVGFDSLVGARTLEIRNQTPSGQLIIYGAALVDANGQIQQLFGRLNKTKYREVLRTDGIVVLENTAAFPRAFLVQNSRVATTSSSLELLESRSFAPHEEVVLAAETPPSADRQEPATIAGSARPALLRPGRARVERYAAQEVAVRVSTPQDTFLVLSDTFYPGWRAYVDGLEQPILRGNLMFRVVQVPEGNHDVVFRFQPMSVMLGLRITLAALAIAAAVLIVSWWPRRHPA